MKKTSLLLAIAAVMWLCGCPSKDPEQSGSANRTAAAGTQRPVLKSLNGIEQGKARNMINYFALHTGNFKPKSNTIWFSDAVIAEIVNVLKSDPDIDGIRLYFAGESVAAGPPKLSFVWVATMEDGADEVAPDQSKTRHKDIYLDDSKYQLFKTPGIEGKPSDTELAGMRLYVPGSGGQNDTTCPYLPNNIEISYAEQMVAGFKTPHVIDSHGEWFDRNLFLAIAGTTNYSGIRIYYAKHPATAIYDYYNGRDAFVITTTGKDADNSDEFDCKTKDLYIKYFYHKNRFTPPKDNGELCPNHCD
jgi:hypothetical protein